MAHPREMETDMQSKDAFDVAVIDTPEHRAQMEALGGELVGVDE